MERPTVLVDAGDFTYPAKRTGEELKSAFFLRAMELLRYDAIALGENEMRKGKAAVEEFTSRYRLPLVSTNIIDRGTGRTLAQKYVIVRVGGKRGLFGIRGGKKIGIFSVILPYFIHNAVQNPQDYEVVDSRLAALEAVSFLKKKGCDLIVALCHEGWNKSIELASSVDGIDIVINGHRSHNKPYSEHIGNTLVVDTGEKRTTFTEVVVTFAADGIRARLVDSGEEALKIERDQRFQKMYDEYEAALKEAGLKE